MHMTPPADRPIRRVVTRAIILAGAVGCAILMFLVTETIDRRLRQDGFDRLRETALSAAEHLDREMFDRYRQILGIAELLSKDGFDEDHWPWVIESTNRSYPDFSWVALVDPDGTVKHANGGLLAGVSVADRPWFKPSLAGPYVGDVHDAVLLAKMLGPDADGRAPRFVDIGAPVRDREDRIKAVLGAHLHWSWAKRALSPYEQAPKSGLKRDIIILAHDGIVLHGPTDLIGQAYEVAPPVSDAVTGILADGRLYGAARTKGLGAYPGLGWTVVLVAPSQAVFGLKDTVRDAVLWSGIPVLLLLLATARLISRRIAAPIEELTSAIRSHHPLPASRAYREIGELSMAFSSMIEQLRGHKEQVEAEVEARTAELRDIQRAVDSHAIVSMADIGGDISYANDKFVEISGYTRDELIGHNHNLVASGRHGASFYEEMWGTILKGEVWQGIICNRRKTGEEYWVRSTVAPCGNEASLHRFISLRTDITDIIRDRERLEELTRELALFEQIIDSTTEAVGVTDAAGLLVYSNTARDRLHGCEPGECLGQHYSEAVPATAEPVLRDIETGILSRKGWMGELPLRRKDGSVFVSQSNIGVVTDETGEIQYIFNIFHDFTKELVHRMELNNARHAAEAANRAKSEFLSSMSHELRTPLNAILGFAQVLLSGTKNPLADKQREYVGHILAGGEHLLELINEVLDLSKIEAGHLSLDIETISMSQMVGECLELASTLFVKYQVQSQDETDSCSELVRADRRRAKQVLLNLISNAAKYNRVGGTVSVRCENVEGKFHRVLVHDTGHGITPEKQMELFKPFSRLGAEASEIEGTGIGLVLSKKLIESMGGRLGFTSTPGEGSCFWLDFVLDREESGMAAPPMSPRMPRPCPPCRRATTRSWCFTSRTTGPMSC